MVAIVSKFIVIKSLNTVNIKGNIGENAQFLQKLYVKKAEPFLMLMLSFERPSVVF